MCEQCYELKSGIETFIDKQRDFYMSYGMKQEEATEQAKRDFEQYIDSLPVAISKCLYSMYKKIG